MNTSILYSEIKTQFGKKFNFLKDKPEETVDSTLKACWQCASGNPMSAEEAIKHPLPALNDKQLKQLYSLLEKRLKNVPLAHIVGRQNFLGIEFLSDKRALIPRKETEILGKKAVELSFELAKNRDSLRVMDICCGSGNLGLSVAHLNPKVQLFASDLSEEAVELAKDNTNVLQLGPRSVILAGDLFSAFDNNEYWESVDLVICNPPYISSAKVTKMDEEISGHEPVLAFDGGMFGFKIIQNVIDKAPTYLRKGGWLIFEVGSGQGEFIMKMCERTEKYEDVTPITDEIGNIRVIAARKNQKE